jgi:dephospho-CoA kinase
VTRTLAVGLTGGIGAGKSEVARLFAERGAVIVDSDVIAREVVEPGTPGLAAVAAEFGDGVLLPDGSLDRPALGRLVFADPGRRARLNAIIHPLVRRRSRELVGSAPPGTVVVCDVPLLVEAGLAGEYDAVVVVDASEETRLGRLVTTRGMSEDEVRSRMAAQASREQRLAAADHVIYNEGDRARLAAEVDRVWQALLGRLVAQSD